MAIKLDKIKDERKRGKFTFLLKGGDEIFANTIRRLIIEEVPTLAVEDVEFRDNSSALYDEMVSLRLGLIPIKTDLKSYELKSKCKCEGQGCARCELKITLKASKKGYVYAEEAQSADPKCTFVYEKMPIVKLIARQKIDCTMTAVLGLGKEHTKWCPGWAWYQHEPKLKIGKVKDPEAIVKLAPKGVFEVKSGRLAVDQEKLYEWQSYEFIADLDPEIAIEETDNFLFTIESWGQLSCKEILSQAADILMQKAEEMENLI
ncbi:DNA-directed RNA polymerase subunit D [Candidatus Woesearchaeota archaeon]|nr:DNA-directed RNA polymerase subunit D [Candidatus Woesearchaeota archaeon]